MFFCQMQFSLLFTKVFCYMVPHKSSSTWQWWHKRRKKIASHDASIVSAAVGKRTDLGMKQCCEWRNQACSLGLRELCSKFSSLFYSKFPQKLFYYAHYYAQNLPIILNILKNFYTFSIKNFENVLWLMCTIEWNCNSLL